MEPWSLTASGLLGAARDRTYNSASECKLANYGESTRYQDQLPFPRDEPESHCLSMPLDPAQQVIGENEERQHPCQWKTVWVAVRVDRGFVAVGAANQGKPKE